MEGSGCRIVGGEAGSGRRSCGGGDRAVGCQAASSSIGLSPASGLQGAPTRWIRAVVLRS